jgi:peptidoglycan hydrolase CwlO-like protein
MVKKLLLVAVIGAAAIFGLRHTKLGGYVKNEAESLKTWAEEQVPVEKEISRLRKEVSGLEGDVRKVSNELAKEIVEVRYLREQTEEIRTKVGTEEDALRVRADAIKAGTEKVNYGKLKLSPAEAKLHLEADVKRLMVDKSRLETLDKTLVARERVKENLEKTLDAMKKQKLELTAQIDAFEAEYKSLQLQQIESKYQTDTTRLASIKESLRSLKKKVDVEREKLNLNPTIVEDAPSAPTSSRSVDEILAPLDGKKADAPAKKQS